MMYGPYNIVTQVKDHFYLVWIEDDCLQQLQKRRVGWIENSIAVFVTDTREKGKSD